MLFLTKCSCEEDIMRSFHAISENIPEELQNVTDMTDIKKDLTFCNFVDIPGSQMFESQNFVLCPLSLLSSVLSKDSSKSFSTNV